MVPTSRSLQLFAQRLAAFGVLTRHHGRPADLRPAWLSQPRGESRVVVIGENKAGINPVDQGVCSVMGGDPGPVGVSDLVIDPCERPPRRPVDKRTSLPVQPIAFVLGVDV
ncbi:hypothetical protein DC74_8126 [Streptomyces noursei]|nr:hypothetical protein DC74_8126 [Streptomyces noursei]